jgi:hypothetical protein
MIENQLRSKPLCVDYRCRCAQNQEITSDLTCVRTMDFWKPYRSKTKMSSSVALLFQKTLNQRL